MINQISIRLRPMPSPRPRVYNNRGVMSARYTEHKDTIRRHCKSFNKMEGEVKATIYFHFKRSKTSHKNKYPMPTGDVDNLSKSVLDALEGIAYNEDRQVTELVVKKGYSDYDMIEIRIEDINPHKRKGG